MLGELDRAASWDFPEINGKFAIEEKVGSGTFSDVFRARTLRHTRVGVAADGTKLEVEVDAGHHVALKRICPSSSPHRIVNEAQLLSKLGGKAHVMSMLFLDRDPVSGRVTLSLPYFEHDHFKTYYDIMNVREIQAYMKALLESLDHLHAHHVIHRDVKPSNFLHKYFKKCKHCRSRPSGESVNPENQRAIDGSRTDTTRQRSCTCQTLDLEDPYRLVDLGLAHMENTNQTLDDVIDRNAGVLPSQDGNSASVVGPAASAETDLSSISPRKRRLRTQRNQDTSENVDSVRSHTHTKLVRIGSDSSVSPSTFSVTLPRFTSLIDFPNDSDLETKTKAESHAPSDPTKEEAKTARARISTAPVPSAAQKPKLYLSLPTPTPPAIQNPTNSQVSTLRLRTTANAILPRDTSTPPTSSTTKKRPIPHVARAGTRGYRAPEVLMRVSNQTCAIDVWSAGAILLSILTAKYPFFHAPDDLTGILELLAVLGVPSIEVAGHKFTVEMIPSRLPTIGVPILPATGKRDGLQNLSDEELKSQSNEHFKSLIYGLSGGIDWPAELIDLTRQLIEPDVQLRPTARDALNHPFFKLDPEPIDIKLFGPSQRRRRLTRMWSLVEQPRTTTSRANGDHFDSPDHQALRKTLQDLAHNMIHYPEAWRRIIPRGLVQRFTQIRHTAEATQQLTDDDTTARALWDAFEAVVMSTTQDEKEMSSSMITQIPSNLALPSGEEGDVGSEDLMPGYGHEWSEPSTSGEPGEHLSADEKHEYSEADRGTQRLGEDHFGYVKSGDPFE